MANNPQVSGVQPLRPPMVGNVDPTQTLPPMPFQFRPAAPSPQSQQFIPVASQHFQPVGRGVPMVNVRLPPQAAPPLYCQPTQQLPPRPGQPGMPPSQTIQLPVSQPNNHFTSESAMSQPGGQTPSSYMPSLGGPGIPLSSSYTFGPSYGQIQRSLEGSTHHQSIPQMHVANVSSGGELRLSTESQSTTTVTPVRHNSEHPPVISVTAPATSIRPSLSSDASDWREHTSADGRRYYYNRKTKLSSWEKPLELMTPTERADASTNWKEFTSPDGRKYYYNKVTKESKWTMPEELKLARQQVEKASVEETQGILVSSCTMASVSPPVVESTPSADTSSSKVEGVASSPVSVAPVSAADLQTVVVPRSSASPVVSTRIKTNADGDQTPISVVSTFDGTAASEINTVTEPMNNLDNFSAKGTISSADEAPAQDKEEAPKGVIGEKVSDIALEDKAVDRESLVYANKLEAKNAFKALLEDANIGSEWTWDRAMRVIINDKRYGALKSLGDRKQAFNEFLGQRKKQEAEDRRIKQKNAREEFKKMLEESTELTSSMRWSKAESLFENDGRFKAVERDRERRDLFENHVEELRKKERAKAQEDRKFNIMEYRKFLESCDFIKASSQWRKVQDRLEADERCSCLEKIDRLEIFQEYIRDVEREEEEQRKIQKEELRKAERKNRDEFRKLMEENVAAGILTAKTHWREYCTKVKDLPAYLAVSSNTSGSTPKDLFEDVAEELQKQYREDKTQIKDAVKLRKIMLSSTWTFEDFKNAISNDIGSPPVSDANLKIVFDELLERVREKEEKDAKKRKHLTDDFFHLLSSIKEITASSEWEDCKPLFEGCQECSSIGEEGLCREIFDKYVMQLKEQEKEREQKRKEEKARKEREKEEREKRKQRREKEAEREKEVHFKKEGANGETANVSEDHFGKENKRSTKDSDSKEWKQHKSSEDYVGGNEDEWMKKPHGSNSDQKKSSRRPAHESGEGSSRHKRHKRDHRHGSHKNGDHEELEDGEFGEGGESW
ncbi:hypothetical protein FNV43_RR21602 [Rhamnella rubrinervis]|uniref:Pre-mRNA-processing protein 40A-like n=1 Tax=Rhamnella rubrinervis TaxID=2594499 RepID=A0A8K0GMC9_9ROSA|nr:hypothetical protein FNV43_RR21602 [Rhamnella rubrinervis]